MRLTLKKRSVNGQAMIQFNQGFIHLPYVLFILKFLTPLCAHYPYLIRQRDATFYLQLNTICLLCLTPFYNLFVINGKKTIPDNIMELLTPRSLAL